MKIQTQLLCIILTTFFLHAFSFVHAAESESQRWVFDKGTVWARDTGTITLKQEKTLQIEHTGQNDWAFSSGQRIDVQPGDVFHLAVRMRNFSKAENSNAGCSVVLRDKNGEAVQWTYSTKNAEPSGKWIDLETRFMVPKDVTTIEPRLVGYKQASIAFENFVLKKERVERSTTLGPSGVAKLENAFLEVDVDTIQGTWNVKDRRTNRTWTQSPKVNRFCAVGAKVTNNYVVLQFLDQEYLTQEFSAAISLVPGKAEILVAINADPKAPMESSITFPPPFASQKGDRLIVPINEGIGFPVDYPNPQELRVHKLIAYGGHGICMGFWGQVDDATGAGYMGILEITDDAAIIIEPGQDNLLQVTPVWDPSQGKFRYERRLRYVFFDQGGHVVVCKRYREHAKSTGLWVPFTQKRKKNPNIDLLIGAANIWCWDRDKLAIVKELKAAGIDRILWSSGGSAEEIAAMNEIPNVLTSRYDIYQDIMDPGKFDEIKGRHGDWVDAAWPNDINWTAPDGTWRKGWEIEHKEPGKARIPCGVICDSKAIPYAKERISKELQSKPYRARFLDTTVAAPWFECYHPNHPMSRSDSKHYKMDLLRIIGDDFHLVCGSETGHEASVPFCDFYEGMMSLGPYRVHESGRNMIQTVDPAPPEITNFQVSEKYRLPLWELVYHDCTVSYWYWGDYNNKVPAVWKKRDLFNALYGVPPMYMFTKKNWQENKERFVESYKTAAPVSRLTGYAEMLEHKVLTEDRTVQQTRFANGVTVTVNFGEKSYKNPDGKTLESLAVDVESKR